MADRLLGNPVGEEVSDGMHRFSGQTADSKQELQIQFRVRFWEKVKERFFT
jgi:hypothetical protein